VPVSKTMTMVKLFACVAGITGAQHWCDGVTHTSALRVFDAGDVEVIYAQAPLFSANDQVGGDLGALGLYHTALIFRQGDEHFTLEFDLTSTNAQGSSLWTGFLPIRQNEDLFWQNDAKWCLNEGILWGRDHWNTTFDVIATVTQKQFGSLFDDLVVPLNETTLKYNAFRVGSATGGEDFVDDVTCANGMIWIRDFLEKSGVQLTEPSVGWQVSRVVLNATSVTPMNMDDELDRVTVARFYDDLEKISTTFVGIIQALVTGLNFKYVYDPVKEIYYELNGTFTGTIPKPQYVVAPKPWVVASPGPAPVPVPPPSPPVPLKTHYGRAPCFRDEDEITVDGVTICAPPCGEDSCTTDRPEGIDKLPLCELSDDSTVFNHCMVRCKTDDDCASDGGVCMQVSKYHKACGFPSADAELTV